MQDRSLTTRSFAEIQNMGDAFSKSGMFPDIKSASQAIVKIQAGAEMGLPPFYAMSKIYIVQGRLMVGAEALGAMVKRSGRYDYRVFLLNDNACELIFTDGGKETYLSKFTIEDARKAGLIKPGSGWEKFPRAMLMSKALSQGARIVCPHVISGAYTPEDFGYSINPETEQIETQVEIEAPKSNLLPESAQVVPAISTPSSPSSLSVAAEFQAALDKIGWGVDNVKSLLESKGIKVPHDNLAEILTFDLNANQYQALLQTVKKEAEVK